MKEYSRYHRQIILKEIGREGQRRLDQSRIAIVGLGALGSVSANLLARAGVGTIRLIDRDFLELTSLQRQVLYDEEDVTLSLPKAVAAARKLEKINPEIRIQAHIADIRSSTADELLGDVDLIIDGTDNFETRFLLNDYSLSRKIPWIYGGAVRTEGMSYVVFPDDPPCLRCLFGGTPLQDEMQTCDQVGILAPVAHLIASFQATEAIKILAGHRDRVDRRLWKVDVWSRQFKSITVEHLQNLPCSGCSSDDFPYLRAESENKSLALCGRNAVQIYQIPEMNLNFRLIAEKLTDQAEVSFNPYLMNIRVPSYEITVFKNGRAIIRGTEDTGRALSLYKQYVAA